MSDEHDWEDTEINQPGFMTIKQRDTYKQYGDNPLMIKGSKEWQEREALLAIMTEEQKEHWLVDKDERLDVLEKPYYKAFLAWIREYGKDRNLVKATRSRLALLDEFDTYYRLAGNLVPPSRGKEIAEYRRADECFNDYLDEVGRHKPKKLLNARNMLIRDYKSWLQYNNKTRLIDYVIGDEVYKQKIEQYKGLYPAQ